MPARFGSLTITPTESSDSAEINAYHILDMSHGAKAAGPDSATPTPIDYAWEDVAAWRWLRSKLTPAEYADLVDKVWSHGNVEATPSQWKKITQGAR